MNLNVRCVRTSKGYQEAMKMAVTYFRILDSSCQKYISPHSRNQIFIFNSTFNDLKRVLREIIVKQKQFKVIYC